MRENSKKSLKKCLSLREEKLFSMMRTGYHSGMTSTRDKDIEQLSAWERSLK